MFGFVSSLLAGAEQPGRVLSLCELMEHWRDYNHQIVRVRAVFALGAEQSWLYDPACRNGEEAVAVEYATHVGGAKKRLKKLLARDGRAWVTLEGVFSGPEPFDYIDPRLPDYIKVSLARSHKRYGHLDAYDFEVKATRVVEVRAVSPEVPRSH